MEVPSRCVEDAVRRGDLAQGVRFMVVCGRLRSHQEQAERQLPQDRSEERFLTESPWHRDARDGLGAFLVNGELWQ